MSLLRSKRKSEEMKAKLEQQVALTHIASQSDSAFWSRRLEDENPEREREREIVEKDFSAFETMKAVWSNDLNVKVKNGHTDTQNLRHLTNRLVVFEVNLVIRLYGQRLRVKIAS